MLAKQGQPLCKPSMGSRASGGERCASERLPPSAMRARRWARTPRRPRCARPSHHHCPRFPTRTSLRASPSGSSWAPGLGGTPGRKEGSDSTSSSGLHFGRSQGPTVARSRAFHIETGGAAVRGLDRTTPWWPCSRGQARPAARILFRRRHLWRSAARAATAGAGRHPLYCAIHTVRAGGASHGASPPRAARPADWVRGSASTSITVHLVRACSPAGSVVGSPRCHRMGPLVGRRPR